MARRSDRARGVEQDGVALRAVEVALEDRADLGGVLVGAAAGQEHRIRRRDPEIRRIDHPVADVAVDDLCDRVGPAGRELVDAAEPVHDEGPSAVELGERLCDRADELARVDAEHACAGACRVRERPEDVEDRARAELAPHRGCVTHRGVMQRCEHEAEPQPLDRLGDPLGRLIEDEAERLEDVGGARRRADGAVAVLGDCRAGRGCDDRRRGGDVERLRRIAAGPDHVDEIGPGHVHRGHVRPHRLGAARDLVRRLALRPERDEESCDLHRGRVTGHDLAHHRAGLLPGQVGAVEQRPSASWTVMRPRPGTSAPSPGRAA